MGWGQDDVEKQRKMKANPQGTEAGMRIRDQKPNFVTEGVAARSASSQPASPSLIQLTLSPCSILAGNSARPWELVVYLLLQELISLPTVT